MANIKDYCICLDPGHSILTPGKRSPYSLGHQTQPKLPFEEWKFNREVVSIIEGMFQSHGVMTYVTTTQKNDGNADIALKLRSARANEYVKKIGKKGLFLSIHANAQGNGKEWTNAKGWSVYTTKGQNNSDVLATYIYKHAEQLLKPNGITMRKDTSDGDVDWEENFTVLVYADMPAVLTENLFYTNVNDTMFLNTQNGKQLIAKAHVDGVLEYIESL